MTPQEENVRLQQQVNQELMAYMDAQRAATKETQKAAETEAKAEQVTGLVIQTFEKLYNANLKYQLSIAKGSKGAATFNDSLDAMTDATQAAAVALSLLVPGGALVKGVVAGLTFLATTAMRTANEWQKMANEQADATYKAFQAFSKAGATGADGLKGFFDDVNRMRLNVHQLDAMAQAMTNNAQAMAAMGGTVYKARGQFADLVQGMGDFEKGMLNLGMSYDEQAEAALGFMQLQSNLTQGQQRDYGKLSGAARKYIEEQEILTRVTGFNRKQQEAAQEKYLSQQRFGAKIQALMDEGTQESIAAAKRLTSDMQKAAAVSDDFGQAFADSVTGMLTTDAAVRGNQSTNGKLLEYQNAVLEGRIKTDEEANAGFQELLGTTKEVGKMMNATFQTGVGEDFLLTFKTFQNASKLANQNFAEQMKDAKDQVEKLAGTIDGADEQLNRFTGLVMAQNNKMLKDQAALNGQFSTAVAGGGFMDKLMKALEPLTNLAMRIYNAFEPLLMAPLDFFVDGLSAVVKLLTGDFIGAFEDAGKAFMVFPNAIAETSERMANGITDLLKLVGGNLLKSIEFITGPLGPIFENVGKTISGFGDSVKTGLAKFTDALVNMVGDLWNKLASMIPGLGTVTNAASSAAGYASNAASSAGNYFSSMFGGGGTSTVSGGGGGGSSMSKASAPAGGGASAPPASSGGSGRGRGGAAFPPAAPSGGPGPSAQSSSNVTTFSDRLINYIRTTERFTPKAFWDKKQYTNGYGTEALSPDEVVTKDEAETRLQKYLHNAVANVISYGKSKKYSWTQGQVDALTSFAYNGGIGMLDKLTQGGKRTNDEIAQSMVLYNKAKDNKTGQVETLAGLTARRAEELAMFQAANGGIFDGPKSGYAATLHGHEAVIPLKDGAVPVSMSQEFNMTATNLGELVAIMKNNVGMQDRMLAVLDDIRRSQSSTADNTGKMVSMAA